MEREQSASATEPVGAVAASRRVTLGSGALLYTVVVCLVIAATAHTQANLLYWSLGLMLGGVVVSGGWSWLSLRGVKVQRLNPGYGVEGEPLVLGYTVTNGWWLPAFGLVVRECWSGGKAAASRRPVRGTPVGWLAHLAPGQSGQVEAPCWPTRRGELVLESVELSTSFPFSVFKRVVRVPQPQRVLVFPRLMRLQPRVLHATYHPSSNPGQRQERPGGHGEFYGLRDYRAGDPMRTIDWKRTARIGRLVTRELTRSAPPRLMVLLDLSDPPWQRFEGRSAEQLEEDAIRLTASLLCEAYLKGFEVGLAVSGPRCGVFLPNHTLMHRVKMLEALAKLDLTERGHRPMAPGLSPTAIVWAGEGSGLGRRGGIASHILGAADLHGYLAGDAGRATPVHHLDTLLRPTPAQAHTIANTSAPGSHPGSEPPPAPSGAASTPRQPVSAGGTR